MPPHADRSDAVPAEPAPARLLARIVPLRRTLIRAAVIAGIVIALVAGIGFFVVPRVVKSKLEETLTTELHRKTTVERVTFNPFTLTATLDGLLIRNRGADSSLFAAGRIMANISSASLWHRAPVINALAVHAPQLHLVRNADGSFNVQDLADAYFSAPPGPPPAFSLNNIEVSDGALTFDDRTVNRVHKVEALHIGIPFLSSLPYDTAIKVVPALAARVDGAAFDLSGETTPFAAEQSASINIELDSLALPPLLEYLPLPIKARVAAGELSTRLKLHFVGGNTGSRTLVVTGNFSLAKLALQRPDGAPLVALPEFKVVLNQLDVLGRRLDIAQATLEHPEFDVRRKSDGELEWEALLAGAGAGAPAAATPPWQVRIRELSVDGATARVEDQSTAPPFRTTLSEFMVKATDLGNAAGDKGRVALSLTTDLGATIKADAAVTLAPVMVRGKVATVGIDVKKLFPYYQSAINLDVADGVLDIETAFAVRSSPNGAPAITMSEGSAELRNLRLLFPGEREPLWTVPRFSASGIAVDVNAHTIAAADAVIHQAAMRLRRARDGSFNFARVMRTSASSGPREGASASVAIASAAPASAKATPPPGAGAPWEVSIKKAALERTAIDFQDLAPATPVAIRLADLDLRVDNFSSGHGKRATIDLATKVGKSGHLGLKGALGVNPLGGNLTVDARSLPLPPLQPYLDGIANLTVTSGAVSMKGRLTLDGVDGADMRSSFAGDIGVADFASLDKLTSSDLLKWKSLTLTGVDAASAPVKLDIGAIALDDFFARIIVYPQGTLNLVELVAPQPGTGKQSAAGTGAGAVAAPPPAGAPSPAGETLPVTIGKVALTKGDVQYSDFFIKPNYSAHLTELNGSISAMSKDQAGDVEIGGAVEHTAPVDIRGRINPFAADIDLDLTGKAREIELPPLSPYAAKYAGYAIEKGKLSFDVHYQIQNRKLTADNKLVLDQLTFGHRVESPTATKLPVLLAVALLKDRNGVIDINLPISGSLDDPKFSLGGLIIQVIVNLLTKAITAPFALLGAMVGGGEQLSYVEFAPGHAAIAAAAETRLQALAKALLERPALKLDITGRADAATDADGLRRAELARAVKAQKRKALAAENGGAPPLDAIVIEPAEYPRFLTAAYDDASFTKPRNAIGLTKTLPPAEMEALIMRNARADAEALRLLAAARGQAVENWLTQTGHVPAERVFLLAPKTGAAAPKDGGPSNRVDFALR